MEKTDTLISIIEAILFVAPKPVSLNTLRSVLSEENEPVSATDVQQCIERLQSSYAETQRSFRVEFIAGGYCIRTLPDYGRWLNKLFKKERMERLSPPALETLAIVAYKQPVTRSEIESVRGVSIDGVLNILIERGLVKIVGRKEVPGKPFIYGTTELFLETFGLKHVNDLPPIESL